MVLSDQTVANTRTEWAPFAWVACQNDVKPIMFFYFSVASDQAHPQRHAHTPTHTPPALRDPSFELNMMRLARLLRCVRPRGALRATLGGKTRRFGSAGVEAIKTLRGKTGAPIKDCKKALEEVRTDAKPMSRVQAVLFSPLTLPTASTERR